MDYTPTSLDSPFVRQMSPELLWTVLIVFALGMAWLVQYQYHKIQRGVLVRGRVLRMQLEKFGNSTAVFPVFEILDGAHKGVVCSSMISTNPPVVAVGEEYDVYYDPEKNVIFSRKAAQYLMALSAGIAIFGMGIFWVLGKGLS